MNKKVAGIMLAAAIALAFNGHARAADGGLMDMGKLEYEDKCAVCHGQDAKGNGPIADMLKQVPSDLTVLARNNGGVFPVGRVYGVIDGRQAVKLHGERTMPVWGRGYLREETGAKRHLDDTSADRERYVRLRILALIDYLHQLQGK